MSGIKKSLTFEGLEYSVDERIRVAAAVALDKAGISDQGDGLVLESETVTENATACSTTIPVTIIDNDGDEAITLANGSTVGQMKYFISSTDNTVTLTPATTAGGYSTIATTNIGETYALMWVADGWAVVGRNSGDTAADNAVDDLPVLA